MSADKHENQSRQTAAYSDIIPVGNNDKIIGIYSDNLPVSSSIGYTELILSRSRIITAHGLGGNGLIKGFDSYGNKIHSFKAFGVANIQGEVHLAVGDVDVDGRDEIATGHGEDGASWVKIFKVNGSLIKAFKAFGPTNSDGEVHLAVGNFDSDQNLEIAVSSGFNGLNLVKIFESNGSLVRKFKAFGSGNPNGEVHLAAGDLNGDGNDEIISGHGEGGDSWVKVFDCLGNFIKSFEAFGPANSRGEVHLAIRNFDSDTFLIGDSPECDFFTIKEAVESDLVSDGDILEVLPGTYQESNITIKKIVTIAGQEGEIDSTIIDGEGSEEIFNIQAHGVTIMGLNITNCNRAIFLNYKKNCQISGSRFSQIEKAILLCGSHKNYITNNIIENANWLSINLVLSHENQIKDNIIDNSNNVAINLYNSNNNILISNKINKAYRQGLRLKSSSNNEISNNHLKSADWASILLSYSSNHNTVTENIINSQSKGIDSNVGIAIDSSSDNTIKNNFIKNCNHNIFIYQNKLEELGWIDIPIGNTIEDNTTENGRNGILLRAAENNEIKNNIIKYNDRGLVIFSLSTENSIVGNTVTNNNQEGILIHPDSPGNILYENTEHSNNLGDYSFSFPSDLNLYWGDIHGHTNKSDGRGSVDEYYKYARDIVKLDISAVSDHGSSPQLHIIDQSDWKFIRDKAKEYYVSNEFVTFSGYEWTESLNYGHHNIYYLTDDELPLIPARENPYYYNTANISELLTLIRISGKDFILIPHHGFISDHSVGDHRYDFQNPPERVASEICSIHGRSEFYQNQPLRTWQMSSYANIQDGLKAGIRLGILSDSDTHMSLPGEWGIFGIYAESLTRESIFNSIKKRNTYGTTGSRIGLWFDINGHMMGEGFSLLRDPKIYIKVKGEKKIDKIEVIKHIENSSVYPFPAVHSEYPDKKEYEFTWTDADFTENSLYYIRVIQQDGEMAWSSPIWVNCCEENESFNLFDHP